MTQTMMKLYGWLLGLLEEHLRVSYMFTVSRCSVCLSTGICPLQAGLLQLYSSD